MLRSSFLLCLYYRLWSFFCPQGREKRANSPPIFRRESPMLILRNTPWTIYKLVQDRGKNAFSDCLPEWTGCELPNASRNSVTMYMYIYISVVYRIGRICYGMHGCCCIYNILCRGLWLRIVSYSVFLVGWVGMGWSRPSVDIPSAHTQVIEEEWRGCAMSILLL